MSILDSRCTDCGCLWAVAEHRHVRRPELCNDCLSKADYAAQGQTPPDPEPLFNDATPWAH